MTATFAVRRAERFEEGVPIHFTNPAPWGLEEMEYYEKALREAGSIASAESREGDEHEPAKND